MISHIRILCPLWSPSREFRPCGAISPTLSVVDRVPDFLFKLNYYQVVPGADRRCSIGIGATKFGPATFILCAMLRLRGP